MLILLLPLLLPLLLLPLLPLLLLLLTLPRQACSKRSGAFVAYISTGIALPLRCCLHAACNKEGSGGPPSLACAHTKCRYE
jgi:hypothetical protein